MGQTNFLPPYDIILLLIGVNNQYRGRSITEFEDQMEQLVHKARSLAHEKTKMVMLSIPDCGITPFSEEKNAEKIATEIDAFNAVCETKARKFPFYFLDIITSQRANGNEPSYIAENGLHHSGKEYAKWAKEIYAIKVYSIQETESITGMTLSSIIM